MAAPKQIALAVRASRPPGPRGAFLIGNLGEVNRDPLNTIVQWVREYGDIVYFRLLSFPVFILARPDYIEQVLITNNRNFKKSRDYRGLGSVLGRGLLTSEGDFWMRQRRLMQPAFYHDRVQSYADIMTDYTARMLDEWRDGEVRDVHEDMMALTLRIVVQALFSADVRDDAPAVGDALNDVLRSLTTETMFFPALQKIPTRKNRCLRSAIERLNNTIYRIIAERRGRGDGAGSTDVLGMLLAARDDDGGAMTDQQIRDEVMTLFLAGHETTALALSWTCYLLAQNPEVERKLQAEVDAALGARPAATLADLPNLPYARMVLNESMRIYPPVWGIGREAVRECEIGGYRVPKGSQIWINQWVMHRDPRYFEDPERFDPERWSGDFAKRLPKFAYFPFGGGPRLCIGQSFALMEAALILATMARRYRLTLAEDANVVPLPTITLRPRYGVRMAISKR